MDARKKFTMTLVTIEAQKADRKLKELLNGIAAGGGVTVTYTRSKTPHRLFHRWKHAQHLHHPNRFQHPPDRPRNVCQRHPAP